MYHMSLRAVRIVCFSGDPHAQFAYRPPAPSVSDDPGDISWRDSVTFNDRPHHPFNSQLDVPQKLWCGFSFLSPPRRRQHPVRRPRWLHQPNLHHPVGPRHGDQLLRFSIPRGADNEQTFPESSRQRLHPPWFLGLPVRRLLGLPIRRRCFWWLSLVSHGRNVRQNRSPSSTDCSFSATNVNSGPSKSAMQPPFPADVTSTFRSYCGSHWRCVRDLLGGLCQSPPTLIIISTCLLLMHVLSKRAGQWSVFQ
jgi:hypothetical protein